MEPPPRARACARPAAGLAGGLAFRHQRARPTASYRHPTRWRSRSTTWRSAASATTFFSGTLLNHVIASVSRVYGGFGLALIVALPLGLMIGRIEIVRQMFDPMLQILRPIPVHGLVAARDDHLRHRSEVGDPSWSFSVRSLPDPFINTVFGVRAPSSRVCSRRPACSAARDGPVYQGGASGGALPAIFTGLRLGLGFCLDDHRYR